MTEFLATPDLIRSCDALLRQGRPDSALKLAESVLAVAPGCTEAHLYKGLALKELSRLDEALAAFEQALALDPKSLPSHVNRAAMLRRLSRSEEALESCDAALALDPDFAPAHCNRGLALQDLDEPALALASFERALEVAPDFAAALGNHGKSLHALRRFAEACQSYSRLLALDPHSVQAHLNYGHTLLAMGDLQRGFAEYEWRLKLPGADPADATPVWRGEDLNGSRLLLLAEQGLGDTLQFARYVPLLLNRGAHVVFRVQKRLRGLMQSLDERVQVWGDEPPPACDFRASLMSLPLRLGTTLESIPAVTPYLIAQPARIARWRPLALRGFVNIGINWQGNKDSPVDRGRSVPLRCFEPLAAIPGVRLIAMQQGAGREQIAAWPVSHPLLVPPDEFDHGDAAFLDSAALLESLDLLITSDTALAHLAGALNRPTFLLLPHDADWRWLESREDSPWYPSLRLFRQQRRREWPEVFARVGGALRQRIPASAA